MPRLLLLRNTRKTDSLRRGIANRFLAVWRRAYAAFALLSLSCAWAGLACAAEPVTSVWIRAAVGTAVSRPEVHSVEVTGDAVVVRSAGLSLMYLGALQSRPPGEQAARQFEFRIPRIAPTGPPRQLRAGVVGVFVNGLPMYRLDEPESGAPVAELVANLIGDATRHSPILGYTLDGSPVYGPWGQAGDGRLRRMRSSYHARRYVAGSGDLDEFNGRIAITPEYPSGVYAHFLSTGDTGALAYPYLVGDPAAAGGGISTVKLMAHSRGELEFALEDANGERVRQLEIVHERPMHLMIVSEDLAEFEHVHPALTERGTWSVPYTFRHRGRYRLYLDMAQRVERFVVDAAAAGETRPTETLQETPWSGEREGLRVTVTPRGALETGRDVEMQVALSGAADIEPYLGAWGHFVLIDERHRSFVHAHPSGGPGLMEITSNFSEPGLYRLWAQFQRGGKVVVIPFTLRVARGPEPVSRAIPSDAIRVRLSAGGFDPARIDVRAGERLKLAFIRDTAPNCAQKVVFPKLGIEGRLDPGGIFVVELPAPERGEEIRFTCGMGMYKGTLVAVGVAPTAE